MPPATQMRKIASEASHGHQPGQALTPQIVVGRARAVAPYHARNWNTAMPGSRKA